MRSTHFTAPALKLSERAHAAVLTLRRDYAELVTRRTIWNAGKQSDQAMFRIYLPEGAVATRLRSRGIGPGAAWFEGELLEAEEASLEAELVSVPMASARVLTRFAVRAAPRVS